MQDYDYVKAYKTFSQSQKMEIYSHFSHIKHKACFTVIHWEERKQQFFYYPHPSECVCYVHDNRLESHGRAEQLPDLLLNIFTIISEYNLWFMIRNMNPEVLSHGG